MDPKNAVYDLATELCVSVAWEEVGSLFRITVDAPRGQHWSDGAVHQLVIEARPTTGLQRDELWIDVLSRMRAGLVECDLNDPACADNALD
jgi:hypothetical protein